MKSKLSGIILLSLFFTAFITNHAFAEIIRGHYCYTYGDNESLKEAKELTLSLATRNAIESYRVYIESTTSVKNFVLTSDIIQIVSSGYLKKMKVIDHKEEGRTICDTIEFSVSPIEIEKIIKQTVNRRIQNVEEKGIDNNGYLKILRINESEQEDWEYAWINGKLEKIKMRGVDTLIYVKVKILNKIYSSNEHCKLFIAFYNTDGEEIATSKKDFSDEIDTKKLLSNTPYFHEWLYPGEIQNYHFRKRDNVTSYKVWLYSEKKILDKSESKTPMRKKKNIHD